MRSLFKTSVLVAFAAALASPAAAQNDFQWHGLVLSGQTIEIRGINGEIRAVAGSGDAQITATKTARRSNPADVKIEVVPHAGGVLVCAVYPTVAGKAPNTCDPSGSHNDVRDNDTQVHFVVSVPAGVTFVGRTVNGDVDGEGLQGDAEVHSVNGSVKLTTSGRGVANTVNGSISVTMGRADFTGEATFKTVNGGVTLRLPASFGAELKASTVNGDIRTDFPVTVTTLDRKSINGTIGAGGPHVTISTVNGSITLQKTE